MSNLNEYPRLVHWSYYDGRSWFSNKEGKERLTKIYITDPKGEDVLKRGKTTSLNQFCFSKDPYFERKVEYGFTSRAKKYGQMYSDIKNKHPELEEKLDSVESMVMFYGDYIYLKLPFLDNYVNPFIEANKDYFFNDNFVYKESFNYDFILKLIKYRPRAMMNGVIDSYEKEELPNLMSEIKIKFPDLYKEVIEESEWLKDKDKDLTLVGKRAKLKSLGKGNVEVDLTSLFSENFYWDGEILFRETLTKDNETMYQTINPSENMVVKIIDDTVVNDATELYE